MKKKKKKKSWTPEQYWAIEDLTPELLQMYLEAGNDPYKNKLFEAALTKANLLRFYNDKDNK